MLDEQVDDLNGSVQFDLPHFLAFEEGEEFFEGGDSDEAVEVMEGQVLSQVVEDFLLFGKIEGNGLNEAAEGANDGKGN